MEILGRYVREDAAMKYLVIGNGYVGRRVIALLAKSGRPYIVADRTSSAIACRAIMKKLELSRLIPWEADEDARSPIAKNSARIDRRIRVSWCSI